VVRVGANVLRRLFESFEDAISALQQQASKKLSQFLPVFWRFTISGQVGRPRHARFLVA